MVNLAALFRDTGDIPWVVGLSGGKDSTAVTMNLLETIENLPPNIRKRKKIFVTSVNTLVEAPPVIEHVDKFIDALKIYIHNKELNIEVVELGSKDIVRDEMVTKIINAYDSYDDQIKDLFDKSS